MSSPDPSARDSTRIGPYRTVRELGRGGQAIVWLAEDSRIGRQVALKVLPALGPGAEDAMRRFRREAEVAARLDHPAICGVFEAELDHGTPYIAMRYVAGETLAKQLAAAREEGAPKPGTAELRELAHFVEKCARALHAAHEAGIVHRDVKPANVMVTPDGEPVILDFGLAREEDGAGHALSLTGEISGTPAYMSPEQMTGRTRADRRSDVWSLGIVLYEAATLAHPFSSATREGLFQAILSDEPPDPRRENPAIDRDLATILETATAKERDRRYQTALDFAEDLEHWRSNEPIRARPVSQLERATRWMQRKPALAASLIAVGVLGLAASALLAYGVGASGRADVEAQLRLEAEQASRTAVAERERAESERARAETERERAEAARAALEQIRLDRQFSDEVDELSMLMGTIWIGLQDEASVPALRPKFLAAFRGFGADLERDVPGSIAKLTALSERDPELWRAVLDALQNLASIPIDEAQPDAQSSRASVVKVLAAFPVPEWPELREAHQSWRTEQVDLFDALLAKPALQDKTTHQLYDLAGVLMSVDGRLEDAQSVLDRAIAREPGSFSLHFMGGALGFMHLFHAPAPDSEEYAKISSRLLHHLQVATALRPRSGFVRAMLATGYALNQQYPDAGRCIEEATALEPDNAFVWLLRARFYSYTPMTQRGIDACKKALELDPSLGGARTLLAELEAK